MILTYDSDGAGVKAALRAIPILREAGISSRVLNMKPYKDPDEFIGNLGADAFRQRIEEAKNSFLFEIDVLKAGYSMDDPEQKTPVLPGDSQKAPSVRGAPGAGQLSGGCGKGAYDPEGRAAPPGEPTWACPLGLRAGEGLREGISADAEGRMRPRFGGGDAESGRETCGR